MGVLNVTPDSFSDGGCFADTGRRRRARPGDARRRRRLRRRRRRVHPARRRPGRRRRGVPPGAAGDPRADRRRGAHQRRHHARRGRRGGDRGRRRRWSTTSAAGWPTRTWPSSSPRPASRGCSCTGAATAARCTRRPGTATSSPRSAPSSRPGWRTSSPPASPPSSSCSTPGSGFAKSAEHNWALLAGLDRLVGLGPAGARRRLPQDVPRPAARRRRRHRRGPPSGGTPRRWPPPCWPREAGAWGVRVHDAAASVDAVRTVEAVRAARGAAPWLTADPDRIAVRGLRAHAHHGVYAFERRAAGRCSASTPSSSWTPRPAAAGDDLEQTVNYAELAQQLYAVLTGEPVDLLETLAQRLADVCLADPLVDAVEITVHKPRGRARGALRRRHRHHPAGAARDPRGPLARRQPRGPGRRAARRASTALKDDGLVARSTLYETPPWGPVEQPPYLNAVVVVRGAAGRRRLAGPGARARAGRRPHPRGALGAAHPRRRRRHRHRGRRDAGALRRPEADPAAPARPRAGVRAGAVGDAGAGRGPARARAGSPTSSPRCRADDVPPSTRWDHLH